MPDDEEQRPDPDALLASIAKEERRSKLKIFFGMCPGVGKTYAMLEAARQQIANGVEVVAGIVETHGRPETAALLAGLPMAPRTELIYRGKKLEEMDLDALIAWHPGLVLVDELAHTNMPGSRHPKRYQDVIELLDAGINVYTTLNVQHVESRKDTVRQITGVEVRETVPDSILDLADEIVLIDLAPSQLLARLSEGKVYYAHRAATAADNFFRESNLVALREMSLRLTAEHVDRDLRLIKGGQGEPWKAGDRLMVAVSCSLASEKRIRWTRRDAASREASWLAVHVETPEPLSEEEEASLSQNLTLARQLGAEVLIADGNDIGETLLRVARQHNVSQIILGKPEPRMFRTLFRSSPVDWLVRHSGEIDIQLVKGDSRPKDLWNSRSPVSKLSIPHKRPRWHGYVIAASVAVGITLVSALLEPYTGYWAIALFYLLGVMLSALRLDRWPTLFLAILSAVLWDLCFIPPRFSLHISEGHDLIMFGTYAAIALFIGHLTSSLKQREEAERRGEARATRLYRLSRALATSRDLPETAAIAIRQIRETFGAESALFVRDADGYFSGAALPASSFLPGTKEEGVAAWVFQHRQPAGRFTDTLPDSEALHLPLMTGSGVEGVLAVKLPTGPPLPMRQRELLEAFAAQIAVTLEKDRFAAASRQAEANLQSALLHQNLFDTISREIKPPLAAITSDLGHPDHPEATEETVARLMRIVDRLLEMIHRKD